MRTALDVRTKKLVDADTVGPNGRYRQFLCPCCRGRVHYKRSIGLSLDPIFAHNPHEGTADCENYYPWQQQTDETDRGSAQRPIRSRVEVEEGDAEFGLCLDCTDPWSLYLRIPEITLSDLRNAPPQSLTMGSVDVTAGGTLSSLPLIDLRPGYSSARLTVPPSITPYKISTRGEWPTAVRKERWQGSSRGLKIQGNLFRFRSGEWVRLRENTAIELNEQLCVIAGDRNSPPSECQPIAGKAMSTLGQNWQVWRVVIPEAPSHRVEAWARSLGAEIVETAWDVILASVPDRILPESEIRVFSVHRPIVGLIKAPHIGEEIDVSLKVGSNRYSEFLEMPKGNNRGYVALSVLWPGQNEFAVGYDDRSLVDFETQEMQSIESSKAAIAKIPALRVVVGGSVIGPFSDSFEVLMPYANEESPNIAVLPDLDTARFDVVWKSSEDQGVHEGITAGAVVRQLHSFFDSRLLTQVQVIAGSFGKVNLVLRPSLQTPKSNSTPGRALWLEALMMGADRGRSSPLATRKDSRLYGATLRRSPAKWLPLVLRTLKAERSDGTNE